MKPQLALFLTLSLLCIGTGAALASTPDGQTPSEETVCDNETGAAYGLCNAYCEAMDCESDAPHASKTACTKVRTKFQNITGRDLPCEAPPPSSCPCNTPEFPSFFNIAAGTSSIEACYLAETTGYPFDDGITIPASAGNVDFIALVTLEGGAWYCGDGLFQQINITPEQGQDCAQLLEQAAANQELTCGPLP